MPILSSLHVDASWSQNDPCGHDISIGSPAIQMKKFLQLKTFAKNLVPSSQVGINGDGRATDGAGIHRLISASQILRLGHSISIGVPAMQMKYLWMSVGCAIKVTPGVQIGWEYSWDSQRLASSFQIWFAGQRMRIGVPEMQMKYCVSSVGCGKKIGPRLQSGFNGSNGSLVGGDDDGVADGVPDGFAVFLVVGSRVGVSPHVTDDAQLHTRIVGSKSSPSSHRIKVGTWYSHW